MSARPPQPLIMAFMEKLNVDSGFAVEPICRALGKLGIQVAARTNRW